MRGFWLPIGVRAAAVFTFGLLVWAGVSYLKRHTHFDTMGMHEAPTAEGGLTTAPSAGVAGKLSRLGALSSLAGVSPDTDLPPAFVLDGRKVGSIVRFQGSRAVRDARAQFSVVVRLAPDARAVPCDIVPVQPDDFDLEKGFRCAMQSEPGLAKFGAVRFEPAGATRTILAAQGSAAELAKGDPFAIDADLTGPMHLVVKGEDGERVQVSSDSHNTALVVNDENGKAVVRMQAGKDGFAITVDTTGR